jgi:hypothetical protein
MNEKERELEELNLEDILQEFGADDRSLIGEPAFEILDRDVQQEEAAPEVSAEEPESVEEAAEVPAEEPETPAEEPEEAGAEETESAEEDSEREEAPQTDEEDDTIRLDDLSQIAQRKESAASMEGETSRLDSIWENEPEVPEGGIQPPPIAFRPKQRLRELKRKLIAGPEKRYYELSEIGVGKLQAAMLVCFLVVAVSAGAGVLYSAGLVPENRQRLMVFSQVLAMLLGALMGSQQMIEGVSDLFHGKFTMNTMLTVTFLACCADSVLCLQELRVPICAAFTLEVFMALWAAYHRRTTEMGQMDTMRKAVRLDSICLSPDYYDGKSAFLRGEGQVEDFMDHFSAPSGPEKIQRIFALLSLLLSAAIGVMAGLRHGVSMGVQIFSTSLLAAVPAGFFVAITRPEAVLERRLHSVGTVLCGWKGIKALKGRMLFPLTDNDIFPVGSTKMNGVKFYGDRDPEVVIAYAAALMRSNGGSLAAVFDQLLAGRSGIRYTAQNLQFYGNGGIGGEINGEPVLMGSLEFLKSMGVEIPEGVMVKQAVYTSIDGELSGLFAITYNRAKSVAMGLATLNGARRLRMVMLAEDFMLTGAFMKEKFGINVRRLAYPEWEELVVLREKTLPEDAPALALTTQEGLAPVAYAITGARALKSAWNLGLVIHIVGGFLGMLIMAALAIVGYASLLSPVHVLLYQLVWMIPGLLVTLWTKVI